MAEDKRLTDVRTEEYDELSDLEKSYSGMIKDTGAEYDKLIDNVDTWATSR